VGQSSPAGPENHQFSGRWDRRPAAWELDFWGKFRRGVESADSAYLASIASYDDVLVTLLGDVASIISGSGRSKADRDRPRDVVKQRGILAIARDRYKGGAATLLDVYQAEKHSGPTEATCRS